VVRPKLRLGQGFWRKRSRSQIDQLAAAVKPRTVHTVRWNFGPVAHYGRVHL